MQKCNERVWYLILTTITTTYLTITTILYYITGKVDLKGSAVPPAEQTGHLLPKKTASSISYKILNTMTHCCV